MIGVISSTLVILNILMFSLTDPASSCVLFTYPSQNAVPRIPTAKSGSRKVLRHHNHWILWVCLGKNAGQPIRLWVYRQSLGQREAFCCTSTSWLGTHPFRNKARVR